MSEWTQIADRLRRMANQYLAYTSIDLQDAEVLVAAAKALELAGKQLARYEAALRDISTLKIPPNRGGWSMKEIASRALDSEVAQLRNSDAIADRLASRESC